MRADIEREEIFGFWSTHFLFSVKYGHGSRVRYSTFLMTNFVSTHIHMHYVL